MNYFLAGLFLGILMSTLFFFWLIGDNPTLTDEYKGEQTKEK